MQAADSQFSSLAAATISCIFDSAVAIEFIRWIVDKSLPRLSAAPFLPDAILLDLLDLSHQSLCNARNVGCLLDFSSRKSDKHSPAMRRSSRYRTVVF